MMRLKGIVDYVERFGELMNKPGNTEEVEKLLLSIPDPITFERIRNHFYIRFNNPFLPTFLDQTTPDQHIKILLAYKKATRNYQ